MAKVKTTRYAFNRGLISPLALARVDLKRAALAAEISLNWMPRTLGSMMLRAGLQYIGATASNAASRSIDFVRSLSESHMLEFTTGAMRIWTDDALVTRPSVSGAVTNGDFDTDLSGWTDNDESGCTSVWVTGGYMGLTGNGTNRAIRDQAVTIVNADVGVENALRIVVERGPVQFRVGTTSGGDELIDQFELGTGTHSLAFTPTTNTFYIRFLSPLKRQVLVSSCNIESAGTVSITSPYLAADLSNIRAGTDSQSVDVMYFGCAGYQQRKVERRNDGRSWSVVLYQPEDGPFRNENTSTQTMTPSVLSGNGTLTSSVAFFHESHVGALFRLESIGQTVTTAMSSTTSTSSIRVTGTSTDRAFTIILSGLTATGNTVVLQRSFDDSTWVAVSGKSWTADTTENYTDGLENQVVYYRLTCTVYAGGTTTATLTISTGSIIGVCRVTAFTSATVVDMEVLAEFGATNATEYWSEGQWSDYRGWPTAATLYEGRLCWAGYDKVVLSESDAFEAFSPDTEGDSASINRSIGSGPLETINWLLPLQRLILGAQLSENSVRSTAFDEPLTPSNFNRKQCSTKGSAAVQAIRLGSRGMFAHRSGSRLFELEFDGTSGDYASQDMTVMNPEVLQPQVVRMAVQSMPDIRIHCVLSDGTAAVLVYDSAEKVQCWVKVDTDGEIEDVCVLPGVAGVYEDRVYYTVARTINSATVRFIEKWALESECQGGTLNKQADAFVVCTGGSTTLSGLSHLIGETVVCWANGKDLGEYTVNGSGEITVSETVSASGAVVGLGYTATWKSAKLGQTLSQHKNVDHLAPVLYNTHAQGLEMGADFDTMDNLPLMYQGTAVDPDRVYASYDEESQEFPGKWDVDARICLRATAPKPCTILAMTIQGQVDG